MSERVSRPRVEGHGVRPITPRPIPKLAMDSYRGQQPATPRPSPSAPSAPSAPPPTAKK